MPIYIIKILRAADLNDRRGCTDYTIDDVLVFHVEADNEEEALFNFIKSNSSEIECIYPLIGYIITNDQDLNHLLSEYESVADDYGLYDNDKEELFREFIYKYKDTFFKKLLNEDKFFSIYKINIL